LKLSAFIAKRVAFNTHKSFSSFITKLSITATALSVATMIVALAIIYGFQGTVASKVFSFWGHIRVRAYQPTKSAIAEESFIYKNDTVEQQIKLNKNVKSISPYATKSAILSTNSEFEGLLMKGVEKNFDTSAIAKLLTSGRWLQYNDTSFSKEILVSNTTAKTLKLKLGDKINVYFFDKETEKTRAKNVFVVGFFKTDIEEYDKNFFIGDLNLIRDLNFWDSTQIGGYEIYVNDIDQLDATSKAINNGMDIKWQSKTIKEEYPNIFDWLNLLDTNKYVLLIIMSVVAAINLITCLIILVLERIKMIGILKALGNTASSIRSIFVYHTLYIAGIGTGVGALVGWLLCVLQKQSSFLKLSNAEAYSISVVPIEVLWWHIPLVCMGTLLLCAIVLLIPAFIINKIKPIDAIQFK
jgi:lipoprotein-releasing system permease protein